MGEKVTLLHGDCLDKLKGLDDCSVDAVVTDPPAGIAFMGKDWDKDKGGRDEWIAWMESVAVECLRVIKPGGHALVWAIPRTSHWTGMAWENAGWAPRDKVYHIFGSGFPKSLNIEKQIEDPTLSKQWEGWGTSLKPNAEEWWLFRKPIETTVAENVLKHGTGALNIDGCRIKTDEKLVVNKLEKWSGFGQEKRPDYEMTENTKGRWPSHVVLDDSPEVVSMFPVSKDGVAHGSNASAGNVYGGGKGLKVEDKDGKSVGYGGEGSAARFFYCAKANQTDRNEGCENITPKKQDLSRKEGNPGGDNPRNRGVKVRNNSHPTIKPIALMSWLCRLITPPNGLVLDPFMGSGSTGKGAIQEGFRFIGIEKEAEYFEIAKARLTHQQEKKHIEEINKTQDTTDLFEE
jgi:site-specific DNA-methyltransferase (adenine-specific)